MLLPILVNLTSLILIPVRIFSAPVIDMSLAARSSMVGEIPNANSFVNANLTCGVDVLEDSGGTGAASSSGAVPSVCSEGSACLNGDLGVYCECYFPQRTLDSTKEVVTVLKC